VFGRLTYAVTDAFRLSAGVRWTDEDKDFSGTLASNNRICVVVGPFGPSCPTAVPFPFTGSTPAPPNYIPGPDGTIVTLTIVDNTGAAARDVSYRRTTWRAGAEWDLSDRNLLYASYETGFKAGGFYFSNFTGIYKPESIRAFTLGSKNRFLDNRLQLNVELFHWKYTDQQISHLGRDQDGTIFFPTENVGAARMQGAELDLLFQPFANTRLGTDVQYLDAVYDEFVYSTPNTNNGIDNGTGCPSLAVTGVAYTVDCSDRRPPRAPEWTVNAGVEQRFPLGSGASLVAEARMHYQSETLTGAEFLPAQMQSGVAMTDFALTFAAREDRFHLTAFVNNAFDETALSGTFPTPFSAFMTGTLKPPRTYGIRAGARF
jgi:iron complex outermembrane receptor protein